MERKLFLKSSLSVVMLLSLFFKIDCACGMMGRDELVIYPGLGVDNIEINKPLPNKFSDLIQKRLINGGIIIDCVDKDVKDTTCFEDGGNKFNPLSINGVILKKITVTSPDFYVVRTYLRVEDDIDDVFRYYGKGVIEFEKKLLTIKYEEYGINFEIKDERIKAIIIYEPVLVQKGFPLLEGNDYKRLKEQFQLKE